MRTAIWWVRRDMRLSDNQALTAAMQHGDRVIPAFVLDPTLMTRYAGTKRVAFLLAGLRQLDADLHRCESRLIVRHGAPLDALTALVQESGATALFAESDYTPYALGRDRQVAQHLPLQLVGSHTIYPPGTVRKADGTPYIVFTPYSRKWNDLPRVQASQLLPPPSRIATPTAITSMPIPEELGLPSTVPFAPGEANAHHRLQAFAADGGPICQYANLRNRVDLEATSGLSPYLRFGMLSARQAAVAAYQAMSGAGTCEVHKGAQTWLNELIWREFYVDVLYHFPHVLQQSFRPALQAIAWENDEDRFAAWCTGQTGYPIVDAAMRQLVGSGWMHNRARMIVASFLVKDLLIDWRWGERFFMQHLIDGDPASNNGGWQWTAGTGTDAAPYFRVFNPVLQNKKFDPDATYLRRWLPELTHVPIKYVHTPWKMPLDIQKESRCIMGTDYPPPIVDHRAARQRTLAAYRAARAQTD